MSVSNFLWNKWCRAFSRVDRNGDGYITEEDYVGIAEFISKKTNASPEDAAITRAAWVHWFHRLTPDPSIDKYDVYTQLNALAKLFLEDEKAFREETRHTTSDLFDNLDLNKDGFISLDELEVFYEAIGITDKRFVKEIFDLIDKNGDGLIERSEYLAAHEQYNTRQEPPDEFEFKWDPSYGSDKPKGFR